MSEVMQLRWGICGCGAISGDFVNALSLLPEDEHQVVALGASSIDRAKSFAQKYNLPSVECFDSYEKLFACSDVDVVYIGVVNFVHRDVALKALNAGKHVLCEKPLGLNAKQVDEMVNCARENKRFFMEGFWSRFFPVYKRMKAELEDGAIGEAKFVMADFGILKPDEDVKRVISQKEGGGWLLDIACYLVQFAQFVFGGQKPIKINVEGWTNHIGVDISGAITLVYPGNKIAQLLYSGCAPFQNRAQIVGTKGRLTIPEYFWSPSVLKKELTGQSESQTFCYELPQKAGLQFNYFNSQGFVYEAQCIRECIIKGLTECPTMSLAESVTISEILDECRKQLGVEFEADKS